MAPRSIGDVLRDRAESREGQKGFTFLVDGEGLEHEMSYAELDRRARVLGSVLAERIGRGERALLVFEAGFDYVLALFACLHAGVLAVPVYPPNPLRPEAGLTHIDQVAQDSQATFALAATDLLERLPPLLRDAPFASRLVWINTTRAETGAAPRHLPELREDDVAILQYTSGSTSAPKGVVLTHGNLIHNARFIRTAFGLSEESSGVSWLPPHHDMGLMGGIIEPMFIGMHMVLFSPQLFVTRPQTFLEAISRFRLSGGGAPNFGYDLLTRRVPESVKSQLDLSCWTLAFCGAEPVRAATLDAFAQAFAGCGFKRDAFLPCYGLAEATLLVTATAPRTEPRQLVIDASALDEMRVCPPGPSTIETRSLVSCGHTPRGMDLVIADPTTGEIVPEGRCGEIRVKGPNVARGYWGNAEASAAAFDTRLQDGDAGWLKTGDLGFLDSGELFVTGRLKDLIIIRGRNLYPQDIEATVEHAHRGVRPGRSAAFSIEIGGEERLIVVCEVGRRMLLEPEPVREAVRRAVATVHGVSPHDVALLEPGQLPRTSSGKPRRSLARQRFVAGTLNASNEDVE